MPSCSVINRRREFCRRFVLPLIVACLGMSQRSAYAGEQGAELPPTTISLQQIYAEFVGSLEHDPRLSARILDSLRAHLPADREIPVDAERERLVRAYLESYRYKLNLYPAEVQRRNRRTPPEACPEEVTKRVVWITAPHYALTIANGILCDPRYRENLSEERREQLVKDMQRQGDEAVAVFDRVYGEAFADHPIRRRLTNTRMPALGSLDVIREDIRSTISDPMQAPYRRIWHDDFAREFEESIRAQLPAMIAEYERELKPFLESGGGAVSRAEAATLSYETPITAELPESFATWEEFHEFVNSGCSDQDSLLLRLHSAVVADLAADLWSRILLGWHRGDQRFDLSYADCFCLPGITPVRYEMSFVVNGVSLIIVDPSHATLDEFELDPIRYEGAPPCDVEFRPDTRR